MIRIEHSAGWLRIISVCLHSCKSFLQFVVYRISLSNFLEGMAGFARMQNIWLDGDCSAPILFFYVNIRCIHSIGYNFSLVVVSGWTEWTDWEINGISLLHEKLLISFFSFCALDQADLWGWHNTLEIAMCKSFRYFFWILWHRRILRFGNQDGSLHLSPTDESTNEGEIKVESRYSRYLGSPGVAAKFLSFWISKCFCQIAI